MCKHPRWSVYSRTLITHIDGLFALEAANRDRIDGKWRFWSSSYAQNGASRLRISEILCKCFLQLGVLFCVFQIHLHIDEMFFCKSGRHDDCNNAIQRLPDLFTEGRRQAA